MTNTNFSNIGVSVFIRGYNNPDYTKRTLQSILMQTYRPIEIILIDDASPTSLKPLFDSFFTNKSSSVDAKYFRNAKNLNPFFSLKYHLDKISRKYLVIMDHDDWFIENSFLEQSVAYMEKKPNCFLVVGNSSIENSSPKMFRHYFKSDPIELKGKTYLDKYLFKTLSPAYSGVVMNFYQLSKLNYAGVLLSEIETNAHNVIPDEAMVSLALLSDSGTVLISNQIVSMRGNPKNSYSKSEEWSVAWSLGVFFPHYKLFHHFLKKRSFKSALSMLKTLIRGRPQTFLQILNLFKKHGFHFYLMLLICNTFYRSIYSFLVKSRYKLSAVTPKKIRKIIPKKIKDMLWKQL